MFQKILVANRGEIACRVMKTARRMGIVTVAVYSEADRQALHVAMADEAVCIGPPPAAQSYLDIARIVAACRETGAEAVHPGYGFLSERADFAAAVAQAGITFIGPNPRAIEAMGDKITSKKLAAAAGVSTVPGFLGILDDGASARRIAEEIGFPVMIKASAGGGGKGMRIAHTAEEVADGFERARSEAKSSFGDDRVFIEKFIENPRHIEIQILGDKHGNVVYLGERECSIQRRNQKVVEEAPSPLLDDATRKAMGEQAVALARTVAYDSAGTVEFVAAQDRSFYFLEMNTRLQVEHPVTELVTGIDLVEQMICVAAGDPLDVDQSGISIRGWAVETRIYAEDPLRDFVPSTGRLTRFVPPPVGRDGDTIVRLDSGVIEGGDISIHYDPMIAKLVTFAPDRDRAIDAQARALDRFAIEGIRHNVPFLSSVMDNARWRGGSLSTRFIADEYPDGFAMTEPDGATARLFAAIAVDIDHTLYCRRSRSIGQTQPFRPYEGQRTVLIGKKRYDVGIDAGNVLTLRFDTHADQVAGLLAVDGRWAPGNLIWTGDVGGADVAARVSPIMNGYTITHRGLSAPVRVLTHRQADLAALMLERDEGADTKALLCPMPGLVKQIHVREGQAVKAGEALCLIEAMKMENVLRAERDVVIRDIEAKEGDSLAVDAPIMTFV